jgi:hypothetical protein
VRRVRTWDRRAQGSPPAGRCCPRGPGHRARRAAWTDPAAGRPVAAGRPRTRRRPGVGVRAVAGSPRARGRRGAGRPGGRRQVAVHRRADRTAGPAGGPRPGGPGRLAAVRRGSRVLHRGCPGLRPGRRRARADRPTRLVRPRLRRLPPAGLRRAVPPAPHAGPTADLEHVARRRRHRADRGGLRDRVRHRRLPRHRAARRPPDRRLPDRRPHPAGAHRRRPRRDRPRCRCRLVVAHRRDGAVRADRHPVRLPGRARHLRRRRPARRGLGPGLPLLRPGRLPVAPAAQVRPAARRAGARPAGAVRRRRARPAAARLPRRRRPTGRRAGVRCGGGRPHPHRAHLPRGQGPGRQPAPGAHRRAHRPAQPQAGLRDPRHRRRADGRRRGHRGAGPGPRPVQGDQRLPRPRRRRRPVA